LRRSQHEALSDPARSLLVARNIVAGKVQNARQVLLRGAREAASPEDAAALQEAGRHLAEVLPALGRATELEQVRGHEGDAARVYFGAFTHLVREDRQTFRLDGRSRRPPRDPTNALLSFLYTLLLADCVAAAEGVGLDPQVGYLHALRPGRPALGLDLMEELRSVVADRLALTLVNRRQLGRSDFEERAGGAWSLSETGRKTVLVAYQQKKQEEVHHPLVDQRVPYGLLPHVQARLLARHLRGDLEEY